MNARIESAAARRAFVLGGRAVFTIVGRTSRFTYKVERADGPDPLRPWFVSVLRGPDNSTDFEFIGTVFAVRSHGELLPSVFRPGRKSRISADAPSVVAFEWSWAHLDRLEEYGAEFWHEGRCSACGHKLTDPESIASGMGPVCRERAA